VRLILPRERLPVAAATIKIFLYNFGLYKKPMRFSNGFAVSVCADSDSPPSTKLMGTRYGRFQKVSSRSLLCHQADHLQSAFSGDPFLKRVSGEC
jgi:hypothetical protein